MLKRFQTLALAQKLTVILLIIFLGGITFSGIALHQILNYKAQSEIASNASLLFKSLDSVSKYTNSEITPVLSSLQTQQFLLQSIPDYSARRVFEILQKNNPAYQNYLYKEAMLNPTNVQDLADDFQKGIIQNFSTNKNASTSGFRALEGEKFFYIARPIVINDSSCLQCHSKPEIAPKAMIKIYGTQHGFNWKLNEVEGAQIVSIPTSEVLQKTQQSFIVIMAIVIIMFALAIYAANIWLKRYVVRPIKRVVRVAEAVSTGDLEADFEKASNDEVGSLVEAFTRMKLSLILAIRRLEQYRIENREHKD